MGGQCTGWALAQMGIGFEDATDADIKKMQQNLTVIQNEIIALQNQMKELERVLITQSYKASYDNRMSVMNDYLTAIEGMRDEMVDLATHTMSDAERDRRRQALINKIELDLVYNQENIYNELMGRNSQTALLDVWYQITYGRHRYISDNDYAAMRTMLDYFTQVQVWVLELMVKYYHAIGEGGTDTSGIDRAIATFNSNADEQEGKLKQPVPDRFFIDKQQKLVIYTGINNKNNSKSIAAPLQIVQSALSLATVTADYFSSQNWRIMSPAELNSIYQDIPSFGVFPEAFLSGQGWKWNRYNAPYGGGVILGSMPVLYPENTSPLDVDMQTYPTYELYLMSVDFYAYKTYSLDVFPAFGKHVEFYIIDSDYWDFPPYSNIQTTRPNVNWAYCLPITDADLDKYVWK